jgi:hypothetical protein
MLADLGGQPRADAIATDLRPTPAQLMHRLAAHDVDLCRPMFDWHPSEATGMLCAAATGTRGIAEIRDHGFPVELNEHTPDVYMLPIIRALASNHIARTIRGGSLGGVEDAIRATGQTSEIDHERRHLVSPPRSRAPYRGRGERVSAVPTACAAAVPAVAASQSRTCTALQTCTNSSAARGRPGRSS